MSATRAPDEIALMLDAGDRAGAGRALHDGLIAHHDGGDARLLCDLHRLAARYWAADPAQVAFHRTHAYVYALEGGFDAVAAELHAALAAEGRI